MSNEKNLLIATRYAESLMSLAKDGKLSYEKISKDLKNVETILKYSQDLMKSLISPMVSVDDKIQIVNSVFERDVDVIIKNFLKVLTEKNRFGLIYDIISVFHKLLDEATNVVNIEVISAVDLSDVEKLRIKEKLNNRLNKQVNIKYGVDESVIAGLIFKMGDDIIDMSVARKLEDLKKSITK